MTGGDVDLKVQVSQTGGLMEGMGGGTFFKKGTLYETFQTFYRGSKSLKIN